MIPFWKYKYSAIVYSNYALLQYMLLASDEQLKKTYYFFVVPNALRSESAEKMLPIFYWEGVTAPLTWRNRIDVFLRYWWVKYTTIYAQESQFISSWLIRDAKYTLLEDAPGIFQTVKVRDVKTFELPKRTRHGIPMRWKYGYVYGKYFGANNQCVNRYISDMNDSTSDFLRGRHWEFYDLAKEWKNASEDRKNFIYNVFNISSDLLESMKNPATVIFTQPFMIDCNCTEEEMVEIYSPYVEQFKNDGVIFKIHPRDQFDYAKYFPGVPLMKTKAPMQLLDILGMRVKRAITICSTAVSPYYNTETEVIWGGAKVNAKIQAVYGDI